MLSPELIEARKVVEDYKRLNKNTVKVVARTCPKMKSTYYETVKVDENAGQFAKLYKEKKRVKKQDKHLGKQLMNAPKPKKEIIKKVRPKKYKTKGTTVDRKARMLKCFNLHKKGYSTGEISKVVGINYFMTRKDLTDYCKEHNIKILGDASVRVLKYVLKGMNKVQIMKELNVTDKTILYHFRKLQAYYPDLEINREPRKTSYNTVRTDTVQRLLKEGKTTEEISDIMNIKEESVKDSIRRYEKKTGTFVNKVHTDTTEKVEKELNLGLNINKISKKLNMNWTSVQYHVEKLENKKYELGTFIEPIIIDTNVT